MAETAIISSEAALQEQTDDADHSESVNGELYSTFIKNLHAKLNPSTYLEVGTLRGATLRLAKCASIAVDPKFRLTVDALGSKPSCLFFQQTSDAFFRLHQPRDLFGRPIDLAFIDGMHQVEFVLRDFINTERNCSSSSIILLHDCLPPGFYMTTRSASDPLRLKSRPQFRPWWTGDVWKIIPILQRYRPDLSLTILDCVPTGLASITNLDPNSEVLEEHYPAIVEEFAKGIERSEYDRYWEAVSVTPSRTMSFEQVSTRFSL